jgi:hypothetical protein
MLLLLPPSTAATINDTAIGAIGSIPPPPPLTMTAIAAINDHHCRCHTVDNNNWQKPAVIVNHWWQQWGSLSTKAAVDGGSGNDGLCHQRLPLMEAAVGWKDDDAMASVMMASLANGGGGNGGRHCQLCSGGWWHSHHPVIGIDGCSKDAIGAAAIDWCFLWG